MINFTEWLKNKTELKEAQMGQPQMGQPQMGGNTKPVRWTMPNIMKEREELARTAKALNINQKQLMQAVRNGRLVALDNGTWAKMQNTQSRDIQQGKAGVQAVMQMGKENDRDAGSIFQGFQTGGDMPASIVLMNKGTPYLVAGNTRLAAAKAMGIRPNIFIITM